MINVSAEAKPEIFDQQAMRNRARKCSDGRSDPTARLPRQHLARNSGGSYPIGFTPNGSEKNLGPAPKNVIFARCLWRAAADRAIDPGLAL